MASTGAPLGNFPAVSSICFARITRSQPLADDRRLGPIEKFGQRVGAPPESNRAISGNPGYQRVLEDTQAFSDDGEMPTAVREPPAAVS